MIINRYLYREIIYTLLSLILLLLLIYVSNRFIGYLLQAASGALPARFIFQLLGIRILGDLTLILPIGFFLSILLALGRLYKDSEITALAACGIPVPLNGILFFATVFAFFVGVLSLYISPWAKSLEMGLRTQAANEAEIGGIEAGRFKEFLKGQGVLYVETVESELNHLEVIFAQAYLPDKRIVMTAKQAYQTIKDQELFLVLQNGHRYESPHENPLSYTVVDFTEHSIRIPRHLNAATPTENRAALPTSILWHSAKIEDKAELQWRFSLPLAILLLSALAVPLSRTTPRQGQYSKIFFGILIVLIYSNFLSIAKKWVERGEVPIWVGIWWVHLLMFIVIALLLGYPRLQQYWRRYQHQQIRVKKTSFT
ncbi:putative permease [Beggiatoa alba B18LD]|uniref:Lipopolysaccharide export system permease protein LptF n=1 Tax=Beggiatoa alba B18LD TaxID=395493 RepID=I3CIV9_9GAMM|nr:LPS export ABC transporter permease LptF [Beggiatoa alba]EIJ43552.1 putative permease [Beggiatoa alba B18LD]